MACICHLLSGFITHMQHLTPTTPPKPSRTVYRTLQIADSESEKPKSREAVCIFLHLRQIGNDATSRFRIRETEKSKCVCIFAATLQSILKRCKVLVADENRYNTYILYCYIKYIIHILKNLELCGRYLKISQGTHIHKFYESWPKLVS